GFDLDPNALSLALGFLGRIRALEAELRAARAIAAASSLGRAGSGAEKKISGLPHTGKFLLLPRSPTASWRLRISEPPHMGSDRAGRKPSPHLRHRAQQRDQPLPALVIPWRT